MGEAGPAGDCAEFFASLDQRIEKAGVIDPGAFRVKGYPYLRVNRFLFSFRDGLDDDSALAAWVDRMQDLDQESRRYEIANLPGRTDAAADSATDGAELNNRSGACGDLLKIADFRHGDQQEKLRESISAPDEYIGLRRVLGVYPLASLFVSQGVSEWQAQVRESFSLEPPVQWRSIRYFPQRKTDVPSARQILASVKRDALGIPLYTPEEREGLFQLFAPIWEIQIQGNYDRIGTPYWTGEGVLDVDTREPVTYTLLSFTRFGGEILTQLNYVVWFPSRPKEHALDIYGGLLDGLNYRVTLDQDGEPLLFDTIHNCGCYYKAYPTGRLQVREKIDYAEPPLILVAPDLDHSTQFITVAMETRTHFVQHLYPVSREWQSASDTYTLADYGRLRSLPYPGSGRRSMFRQDSIVPGSERLERFILWPTGVLSPGGMRQWGRHAVAFVGERQFDDPFFMDKMYVEGVKSALDSRSAGR